MKGKVVLSYADKKRCRIRKIVRNLQKYITLKNKIVDGNCHKHQLARPDAEKILQGAYRKAKLIVVFFSSTYHSDYRSRMEWKVIKQKLYAGNINNQANLMLIKLEAFNRKKLGIEKSDGYIDAEHMKNKKVVQQIFRRWKCMKQDSSLYKTINNEDTQVLRPMMNNDHDDLNEDDEIPVSTESPTESEEKNPSNFLNKTYLTGTIRCYYQVVIIYLFLRL